MLVKARFQTPEVAGTRATGGEGATVFFHCGENTSLRYLETPWALRITRCVVEKGAQLGSGGAHL